MTRKLCSELSLGLRRLLSQHAHKVIKNISARLWIVAYTAWMVDSRRAIESFRRPHSVRHIHTLSYIKRYVMRCNYSNNSAFKTRVSPSIRNRWNCNNVCNTRNLFVRFVIRQYLASKSWQISIHFLRCFRRICCKIIHYFNDSKTRKTTLISDCSR